MVSTPGPLRGGRRITKGTKVREHERGGHQRGWHGGGDLAVAGTAATLRVPETRAEQGGDRGGVEAISTAVAGERSVLEAVEGEIHSSEAPMRRNC